MGFGIRLDQNGMMLRPTRSDEVVRRRAAEMALPILRRWHFLEETDSQIVDSIMKHIDGANGYEIVKSLEHEGWCGNAELVEIMDRDFIGDAERELVEQWVRCLGITLTIPVGTPVKIKDSRGSGVVTKHYPESTKYGVHTPVRPESSYWIVTPEEIEVLK